VSPSVALVADGGPDAGLGHVSRCSALAVALRCRGVRTACLLNGSDEPLECDGISWTPLADVVDADVLVLDSYRLSGMQSDMPLVVFDDAGESGAEAALVVDPSGAPVSDGRRLAGFRHACLRSPFWGLPERAAAREVRSVLVAAGSGGAADELATAAREALSDADVRVVRGPYARQAATGADVIHAPASLLEPLLGADLVVTGAGQTMLEAAAAGAPCVAVALAENQRRQGRRLAAEGAVRFVEAAEAVRPAIDALVADHGARAGLARRAQQVVDGLGALRVAFRIAELAGRSAG
jgi:spore coat polysaccharide biosynthesis predicted glycosyltransferase SpsG